MVFESLFQCTYPVPSEPVVFKTHPTIPQIEASKCGFVRCKVEDGRLDSYSTKGIPHLVYECWSGEVLPLYTTIRYKNLNPYDLRFENLKIYNGNPLRSPDEKAFYENTITQMLLREEMLGEHRDMLEYFKQIGMPQKYITGWSKRSKNYNPKQKKKLAV